MADSTPSRRDFLNIGVVATATVVALEVFGLNALQAGERKNKPKFLDVPFGTDLKFEVAGRPDITQVQIFYAGAGVPMSSLNLRQEGDKIGIVPFENGTSKVRMVGEVLSNKLVRVGINPDLPEGERVTLHKEPGTLANIPSDAEFPKGDNVYGLQVITARVDMMKDKNAPIENNANPQLAGVNNLTEFGCGYAVGNLYHKDGKEIFSIRGYVPDARALEVITQ